MINIIGLTEQEAKQIYSEAEQRLKEKNTEIDKENEERKKVNAKRETFKKWEDKIGGVCTYLMTICMIGGILILWIPLSISTRLNISCLILSIGLLILLGSSILKNYIKKKYGPADLTHILDHYSIDDNLPVAYQYYELCQKYGQPIKMEWDDDEQIDLVFVDADNTIVKVCLDLGDFEYLEKYKLSEVTIDLMNKRILAPYG